MKKTVTITVDETLWELAGQKLPSRSKFFEDQFQKFIELEDDEKILIDEISSLKKEIDVRETKLCKIKRERDKRNEQLDSFSEPMENLKSIHSSMGRVGENQIKHNAKMFGVDFDKLLKLCKDAGWNVSKYGDASGVRMQLKED